MAEPSKGQEDARMSETEPLFPELVISACVGGVGTPNSCGYAYSLLAYWPRGRYWKIHLPLAFASATDARINKYAEDLLKRGWTHIHVLRLPEGEYPWNEPK